MDSSNPYATTPSQVIRTIVTYRELQLARHKSPPMCSPRLMRQRGHVLSVERWNAILLAGTSSQAIGIRTFILS